MGHRPHLYLPPPWTGPNIQLNNSQRHHLRSVLRLADGELVTYTDGLGATGSGQVSGDWVMRADEENRTAPRLRLTLAVAPPRDKDRTRFLVEKAAELEVTRLVWLETRYGHGHPPPPTKAQAWAVAGLEQSRGAYLLEVKEVMHGPDALAAWGGEVWFADEGGGAIPSPTPDTITVAIGPEGGWAPEELPDGAARFGLGRTILRVETAALAAAVLLLRL
ncbi:MAG TPA: 16S rRNA (uracil(1498)-N(3))-methyltransferase [Acidimicrobiia bacterium]|nr:16S rRNA (uracil(1498)-N(3))-methyltransferase [Acidimicrobiia bacterium]